MKFNKWTLGLAAVGVVSLASVAQAEEKASMVQTAVNSTTLSGYVDTSVEWNPGDGNAHVPAYAFNAPGKADGFNLDAVLVRIQKPMDEGDWSAGYDVDLFMGPDANSLDTTVGGIATTDFAIKQAYVNLRTPIAGTTGIDWKLGVFDNGLIGYESTESPNNPNFTRSYGYTLEPTTFTGLMGTYKINDMVSVSAGIANTTGPIIGGETVNSGGLAGAPQVSLGRANPPKAESYKTYMGSVAFTAPKDWGFVSGSSVYAGFINGWGGGPTVSGVQQNFYTGATLNMPDTRLQVGASYDWFNRPDQNYGPTLATHLPQSWANDIALYTAFQATEKLSFHTRAEYLWQSTPQNAAGGDVAHAGPIAGPDKVFALTADVQYDLWKNVLSRVEIRWDHETGKTLNGFGLDGPAYGGSEASAGAINGGVPSAAPTGNGGIPAGFATKYNSWLLAANLIYKF